MFSIYTYSMRLPTITANDMISKLVVAEMIFQDLTPALIQSSATSYQSFHPRIYTNVPLDELKRCRRMDGRRESNPR